MTAPSAARRDYDGDGLAEADLAATPFAQAQRWIDDAKARSLAEADVPEPSSIAVATVDDAGMPDVRVVLMRFFDPTGPGFLTHLDSTKSRQLTANPQVAAALTWPAMFRAIRFRGTASHLPEHLVADYFASRPWGSRISAWASEQSRPVASRAELEERYAALAVRYPDTGSPTDVPLPPRWGGWRVTPDEVEFWGGRRNRLHDRIVFARVGSGSLDTADAWSVSRRQP